MNTNRALRISVLALVAIAVVTVLIMKQPGDTPPSDPDATTAGLLTEAAEPGEGGEPAPIEPGEGGEPAPIEQTAGPDGASGSAPDPAVVETSGLPRLVDLGADRCIPCKKMAPILEALREDFAGQFDVVFIDVWRNQQAGVPYNVRVIPTQIFFDEEGNELFRHVGFFSREDILGKWAELGYVFDDVEGGTDAGGEAG